MNDKYSLKWLGGEIDIWTLGCKIVPKFKLKDKIIEPLHSANWIGDESKELTALPGVLKNLRGEFPCIPFGINSPVDDLTNEWKETYSEKPYIVNDPHGFCSNNIWELVNISENKATFKIIYPKEDLVDYLIRTIEVNDKDLNTINCSLSVKVKEDCSLPVGLHPMIKIPSDKNKIKIIPGNFKFGLTYPGVVLAGKTLGAVGKEFSSIEKIPGFDREHVDISKPPLDGNYEDLFQLCGIDGVMKIENYEHNYSLTINWNPEHFSSVLMWISNKGREEYPWSKNHVTVGLEPISSTFGLSTYLSNNPKNPIHSRGVKTFLEFKQNQEWISYYSFSLNEI